MQLTQQDLAGQMGMSVDAVRALERATRVIRTETLARLEHELGWVPGSCEEVLRGGTFTRRIDDNEGEVDEAEHASAVPLGGIDDMMTALVEAWGTAEAMRSLARISKRRHDQQSG